MALSRGSMRVSEEETARLGEDLREPEEEMPSAVAAFRLLLLTGCQMLEIGDLKGGHGKEDCIEHHTFAVCALVLGGTLPVIAKLLGHSDVETTARHAHLARDSTHDAAELIAESTSVNIL